MAQNELITCPKCGFSREVNPGQLPASSVIATCPKCSCRFRFSTTNGVGEIVPPKGWHTIKHDPDAHIEEGEEDIRATASRAYQREADRFAPQPGTSEKGARIDAFPAPGANPWDEAPGERGWLAAFFQTVVRVMFSAPAFFGRLDRNAQQVRPLAFYLVIGVFQTMVERFWGQMFYALLSPSAVGDPNMEKMLAMLAPDTSFALSILLRAGIMVLQLYFFSFLMFAIYRLLQPKLATFSLVFQVMAYSAAPSLLCVVPVLGSLTGLLWGIGCMAVGCKVALRLDWARTLLGFLPLLFFLAPLLPQMLALLQK